MIPVLVTGGAGYIGSHTAKLLANSGFKPIVLDNLSTGHRWAVKWGPLIEASLADGALLRELIATYRIKAVIHFAARAFLEEPARKPRQYFRHNVVNTLNLLDAVVGTGMRHFVFSSTCPAYGFPEGIPIPEAHPQHPVNPFDESEHYIEGTLRWYGLAYGLRWVALRYFNAAGADLDGELGEEHHPEPHLIPRVIEAALGRLPHVEIYGTDYPTPDGTAIRDYVHVTDLAEAHVLALNYLLEGGGSAAINLGTGSGHSVREVIAAVERVIPRRIPIREAPRRLGDPPALVADPTRAVGLFQWRPRYSSIDTVVETALRWHAARMPAARAATAGWT